MKLKNLLLLFIFTLSMLSYAQIEKKYTTHIVKSGETLRSIAKKYNCKTKEIRNLNPDVDKKNIPINTTLVVPNPNFGKVVIEKKEPEKEKEKLKTYKVKEGDTFYGIAKRFNVTIQSLKDVNPFTVDGLQAGKLIRIPAKSEFTYTPKHPKLQQYKVKSGDTKWHIANAHQISVLELEHLNPHITKELKEGVNIWVPKDKTSKKDENPEITTEEGKPIYIYHLVQKGENLFRIAVMYETTQEEISALNPEAIKKLRPGMLLKIPGKKKDKFLTHEVVKGDTFYNITRRYKVTTSNLLALNPELKDGLKLGNVIKIKTLASKDLNTLNPVETGIKFNDSLLVSKKISLSFLLPLMSDVNATNINETQKRLQDISLDFYMGAEIAIDSLKKQGIMVTHHIFDTKKDLNRIRELSHNKSLAETDLFIGPLFYDNAKVMAKSYRDKYFISPIFSKKQISDHTNNIVKMGVDESKNVIALDKYLMHHFKGQKVILIADNDPVSKSKLTEINNFLKTYIDSIQTSLIYPSHNKKRPEEIFMDKEKMENAISESKANWVILISKDNIVTSDVVNTYGVMANDTDIRLFTTKEFLDFNYLDFKYLAELNWSFPSASFTKTNTKAVRDFIQKYKTRNFAKPSTYAFKGFDITYESILRKLAELDMPEAFERGYSMRLAHRFDYREQHNNYNNEGVFMVKLNKDLEYEFVE